MVYLFDLFVFLFGTVIGSFLNVLIDRLPKEESLWGRSHCDYCKKQLAWYDLIPFFSFVLLFGKCRYCHKKISFYYPFIEALTGILFVLSWEAIHPIGSGFILKKIIILIIMSCLIVIFFADLKYRIIPDSIQVILFVCALFFPFVDNISLLFFANRIAASFIVMSPILFLYFITKGKGMGFGDVKYAFSMGMLLGVKSGLFSLYIAFILGAFAGLTLIVCRKKDLKSKIAFGPFLVLGTLILIFFQQNIFQIMGQIYRF